MKRYNYKKSYYDQVRASAVRILKEYGDYTEEKCGPRIFWWEDDDSLADWLADGKNRKRYEYLDYAYLYHWFWLVQAMAVNVEGIDIVWKSAEIE